MSCSTLIPPTNVVAIKLTETAQRYLATKEGETMSNRRLFSGDSDNRVNAAMNRLAERWQAVQAIKAACPTPGAVILFRDSIGRLECWGDDATKIERIAITSPLFYGTHWLCNAEQVETALAMLAAAGIKVVVMERTF